MALLRQPLAVDPEMGTRPLDCAYVFTARILPESEGRIELIAGIETRGASLRARTFRVTRPLRVTEAWRSQTRERVKGRVHAVVRARRNMILDH